MNKKKILFITGTRADFGKLKSLILSAQSNPAFEVIVFATGMHMLSSYGNTVSEISKSGVKNIFPYINQIESDDMPIALANTISGLTKYIRENVPDLLVVHGDRLEALGAASAGALMNIPVAHIEGGERSGTIDESIRHAVSKFSHVHFVSNKDAKSRLLQMGENENYIHVIGSPNVDVMLGDQLPSLHEVRNYYEIEFDQYAILIFHPVTTELDSVRFQIEQLVKACNASKEKFVVIYPNNDQGRSTVLEVLVDQMDVKNTRFIPSMRFEYYLTLLKNAKYIIGNSSSGLFEAPIYGVPTINIGTRQNDRFYSESIRNVLPEVADIVGAMKDLSGIGRYERNNYYGLGDSAARFIEVLESEGFFNIPIQKKFIDDEKRR